MPLMRLAVLTLAVCCALAGLSVAVEAHEWWGFDAGSSYTALVVAGYLIALVQGGLMGRDRLRLKMSRWRS